MGGELSVDSSKKAEYLNVFLHLKKIYIFRLGYKVKGLIMDFS